MIQARELRIGNWVEWVYPNRNNQPNKFQFCQIESIRTSLVGVLGSAYGYDQIQPIPLTPEILEKCGFERRNYGWIINKLKEANDSYFGLFYINDNAGDLSLKLNSAYCPCAEIKHLHQLQNLYFALTGEELTFKP